MPYLKEHIRKQWVSANAGDQVRIIGDHGEAQIVEDKNGTRFLIRTELLSETAPDAIPVLPETAAQLNKSSKKRRV